MVPRPLPRYAHRGIVEFGKIRGQASASLFLFRLVFNDAECFPRHRSNNATSLAAPPLSQPLLHTNAARKRRIVAQRVRVPERVLLRLKTTPTLFRFSFLLSIRLFFVLQGFRLPPKQTTSKGYVGGKGTQASLLRHSQCFLPFFHSAPCARPACFLINTFSLNFEPVIPTSSLCDRSFHSIVHADRIRRGRLPSCSQKFPSSSALARLAT